jgi:pteridine reductase
MKTALITGGAKRIGREICRTLHQANFNIIIHYHTSKISAQNLADELNKLRHNSAQIIQADLSQFEQFSPLCESIKSLDVLVNNASIFYPTPLAELSLTDYQKIMDTNLKAPLFLSAQLSEKIAKNQGCIVNIVDIHADRPLRNHAIYNISKAAIAMMTKTLAKELAPEIRVNGVAPGSILWPENAATLNPTQQQKMLAKIALKKQGSASDIADTVLFLTQSNYVTGQIITVDGGRSLNQ